MCLDEGLVNEQTMRALLCSFISGAPELVLKPLLQLMSAVRRPGGSCVRWVPFHIMAVLNALGMRAPLPLPLCSLLLEMVELFETFRKAKEQAGDGWEALFALTLLIRSLSGAFEHQIFPLSKNVTYSVSFNEYFDVSAGDLNGASLDSYLRAISLPRSFPHIAVYMPQHAKFEPMICLSLCTGRIRSARCMASS